MLWRFKTHDNIIDGIFVLTESKYSELPYYIPRTKNHMMPVYLEQSTETLRKFTKVCHIRGDIWVSVCARLTRILFGFLLSFYYFLVMHLYGNNTKYV